MEGTNPHTLKLFILSLAKFGAKFRQTTYSSTDVALKSLKVMKGRGLTFIKHLVSSKRVTGMNSNFTPAIL